MDKMVAFSSVAKVVQLFLPRLKYIAGIWREEEHLIGPIREHTTKIKVILAPGKTE